MRKLVGFRSTYLTKLMVQDVEDRMDPCLFRSFEKWVRGPVTLLAMILLLLFSVPLRPSTAFGGSNQVNIPVDTWVAIPAPAVGNGPCPGGTCKHMRLRHNPLDGRIYVLGGDWTTPGIGTQNGNMEMWSYSVLNNDWRQEQPYCRPGGGVQAMHPDEVGWAWDSTRNVFWMIPGFQFNNTSFCPPTATLSYQKVMTFDPATKTWTDTGIPFPEIPISVYHEYNKFAQYDAPSDTLIQLVGNNGAQVAILNIQRSTWTLLDFSNQFPVGRMGESYSALDPVNRVIYGFSPLEPAMYKYDIAAQSLTTVASPPAGSASGTDLPMPVWDSANNIVLLPHINDFDGKVTALYVYHPDTNSWETRGITQPPEAPVTGRVK